MSDLDPAVVMAEHVDAGAGCALCRDICRDCDSEHEQAMHWPCLPYRLAEALVEHRVMAGVDAECMVRLRDERDQAQAALDAERTKVQHLRLALGEAAADVEDYIQYAGDYLAEKWQVADDVARYKSLAGES